MMQFKSLLLPVMAIGLVSGCQDPSKPADIESGPKPATEISAVRATIGKCMFAPDKVEEKIETKALTEALAGIAIKTTIEFALNSLGKALEEAAKSDAQYASALVNIRDKENVIGKCIQFVRGTSFETVEKEPDKDTKFPTWLAEVGLIDKHYKALVANRIAPAKKPEFIFEATFRPAGDGTTLAVVPTYVALIDPIRTRFLRPDKDRAVAMHIAFHTPGKSADAETNPAAAINIGNVKPNTAIKFPQIKKDPMRPTTLLPSPGESAWVDLKDIKGPYSITMTAWEVQDGSKTAEFFLALFNAVRPTAEQALKEATIKSAREEAKAKRAKAELDAIEANLKLRDIANQSNVKAIAARAECIKATAKPNDEPSAEVAYSAIHAMRQANLDAFKADILIPFPKLKDVISPTAPERLANCRDAIL